MARFLIEVPHESDKLACARAVRLLLSTGSHFLTHADFGCYDGVHKAWVIVEVENKEIARSILPGEYRRSATIIQLNKFTLAEIDQMIGQHTSKMEK
jgi:hypothetical protein